MANELNYQDLLESAINEPGKVHDAYRTFHGYSIGNQFGVLVQCEINDIEPGPIAGYRKWQELGRQVQGGEKALGIWIPITYTFTEEVEKVTASGDVKIVEEEKQGLTFKWKNCVFVLSQTEGDDVEWPATPEWDRERAMAELGLELADFDLTDGNIQGAAEHGNGKVQINPVAAMPFKTLVHEMAHHLHGHTNGREVATELAELEAEGTALIVLAALGFDDHVEFSAGYIQSWWGAGREIPEDTAKAIFSAANKILQAGQCELEAN